MPKRTKLEVKWTTKGNVFYATIKEVFVDSGRVKRVWVKLDCEDSRGLQNQIDGAMAYIASVRKQKEEN